MKVTCDECNKEFDIELKTKKHKKDIEETFFKCEHCGTKYTTFVSNTSIRRKQRRVQVLHNEINKLTVSMSKEATQLRSKLKI